MRWFCLFVCLMMCVTWSAGQAAHLTQSRNVTSPATTSAKTKPVATQPYHFTVDYDIYAGGMHLLDVTQQFALTTRTYSSDLLVRPTGFFNKIVPWEGRYATTGLVDGRGQLIPQRHSKTSRWGDERDETVMQFDQTGRLIRMTERDWLNGKPRPAPQDVTPPADLSRQTIDLVTAVLRMLQTTQQNGVLTPQSCQTDQVVFDGKRRFIMAFRDIGTDTLAGSNLNAFKGKARHCQIEIKPLAGFPRKNRGYYKIQEDSRAHGGLPSLWLMPAWIGTADKPAPPIPVRMLIKSEYGAILVHASHVTQKD